MKCLKSIFRSIFGSKSENISRPEVTAPVTKVEEPPVKETSVPEAPVKVEPVIESKKEEPKVTPVVKEEPKVTPVVKEEPKSTAKEIKAKIKKPVSTPASPEVSDKPRPKRKRPSRSKKPKQEGQ